MWLLYQIAMALALVVAGPFLLLSRGTHYLTSLPGRLGRHTGEVPRDPLWIHAVSVGEVGVAHTLAQGLPADLPLLVTTITPTGQSRAQALFKDRGAVTYLPFDFAPLLEAFLRRFSPRALVLVEGDLWPLALDRTRRHRLPIVVINGRISDRSFRRMARCKPLLRPLLGPPDRFGMQSEVDRQRLLDLGVETQRVEVTGNLKFETPPPRSDSQLNAAIHDLAAGRPVLVAGSTMSGEEERLLQAFRRIGGGERALLILAPRHPERWDEVAELLTKSGLRSSRRSQLGQPVGTTEVLLLDSLGELASIYQLGIGCFIGGTLVATGGHNPLEAAQHGVPVSVGPSMENFRDIAAEFSRSDAWCQVQNADELAAVWRSWLDDPRSAAAIGARGAAVVAANRGSLATTLAFLEPFLGDVR